MNELPLNETSVPAGRSVWSGGSASLLERPAGYSVIAKVLRLQRQKPERSAFARLFGATPLHPDAVSWFSGAIGERPVGGMLDGLGPEWTVMHAVPVGTGESDIDHVVIGPAGVFTVNTKRHVGKKVWVSPRVLLVSGQKQDHLRNARSEAKRAADKLTAALGEPVTVHPLVVIVGAESVKIKEEPTDVTVLRAGQLLRWLTRRAPTLDDRKRERLVALACNPLLWHATADSTFDIAQLQHFDRLRGEVTSADRRRAGWVLLLCVGLVIAVAGAVWAAVPLVLSAWPTYTA
jgi:hypothetical protein